MAFGIVDRVLGDTGQSFLVIAGAHGKIESAEAEARSFQLLKIPAVAQLIGSRYLVIVGQFDTMQRAENALAEFEKEGHAFSIAAFKP